MDILLSLFSKLPIWKQIDTLYGKRHGRAIYSYSDAVKTWVMNVITGSRRLEHSYEHRYKLQKHPGFKKGMSPDTISRLFKKFAVKNTYYDLAATNRRNRKVYKPEEAAKAKLNEVNCNLKLNALLIDAAIAMGLLVKGNSYALDIDATVVESHVSDARITYLHNSGYAPMVVFLDGIPVFVESRNGNSSPNFRVAEVLEDAIELVESKGIAIKFTRIDAAGGNKYVVKYLMKKNIPFYIRARSTVKEQVIEKLEWEYLNDLNYIKAADTHVMMGAHKVRAVNYSRHSKGYEEPKEWSVISNDEVMSRLDVIKTYNGRGAVEQRFSDLNEMGWNYMVYRELKYNSVHLCMTMLAYLLFVYAKRKLSEKVPFVKTTFRPKTFIKKFITVFTTWIDDELRFLSREKEFAPLKRFV